MIHSFSQPKVQNTYLCFRREIPYFPCFPTSSLPRTLGEIATDWAAYRRYKKIVAASALIWRTLMVAEKRFRRLNAPHLLKDVYAQHHRKNKITIDSGKKLAA